MCDIATLLGNYVNNIFDYFRLPSLSQLTLRKIKHVDHDPTTILFSSRRKKPFAPKDAAIGRRIDNEEELIRSLETMPNVRVKAVEFFELSFEEQLRLFQTADILMGVHGKCVDCFIVEWSGCVRMFL